MSSPSLCLTAFEAAVSAVSPANCLLRQLQVGTNELAIHGKRYAKTAVKTLHLWAIGKAAPDLYHTALGLLEGWPVQGLCIYKQGLILDAHLQSPGTLVAAGHPVPNENSVVAAQLLHEKIASLQPGDLVLLLISGGASALVCDLPAGLELPEFQMLTDAMVRSGASIAEINLVRSALGTLKGGKLAHLLAGHAAHALLISDVPGNNEAVIGSGLTRSLSQPPQLPPLSQWAFWPLIDQHLQQQLLAAFAQPFVPAQMPSSLLATNELALEAAAEWLRNAGVETTVMAGALNGQQDSVLDVLLELMPSETPARARAWVLGGETQLLVSKPGVGGRNMHLALSFLQRLVQRPSPNFQWQLLCAGTDGNDGNSPAAGAIAGPAHLARCSAIGPALEAFNSHVFFQENGGLLVTGPTGTNVMDMAILMVHPHV